MEKASIRLVRPETDADVREAAVDVELPSWFVDGHALEYLETFKRWIEGSKHPIVDNARLLGDYRQVLLQAHSALRLWASCQSINLQVYSDVQAELNSLQSQVDIVLKQRDRDLPERDGHKFGIRIFLDPARYEKYGTAIRTRCQEFVRDVVKHVDADHKGLPAALVSYEDYDTLPDGLAVVADVQKDLRRWFVGVTGWEVAGDGFTAGEIDAALAFRDFIEGYVHNDGGMPDRPPADIEELYREAMSTPELIIPAPFREAVQSFRHSGRRPA